MHKLTTFAMALAMTSVFAAGFWAQIGIMAADAAGAPARAKADGIALKPYQDVAPTYGPGLAKFASLAR
ncbi:MAG TPA: hypothetical protein VH678_23765 [Xanthobacteraceae bacterium]|jgi:hypothetical protein